jgi:nitrogen fixation protein FixH
MKPGIGWPIGVAVLLGATVIVNLWVMQIANADPAFAVEPDYYRKAVNYDSTIAQQRQNVTLGWAVDTRIGPIGDGRHTTLTVTLRDATTQPLTGARVAVMTRYNARANDTLTAVLTEAAPGQYETTLPIAHPGEWEVRVDATQNGARFEASTRVTAVRALAVAPATPAPAKPTGALR